MKPKTLVIRLLALAFLFCLAACAGLPPRHSELHAPAYVTAESNDSLLSRYAPLFILEEADKSYNRIGTPAIRAGEHGEAKAYIDPARPSLYAMQRTFHSRGRNYTNLIYRVHFEKIPYRHLTAGRNVGLLILITLDENKNPLLLTSVHTCGCYLTFIPTSYLAEEAYPDNWPLVSQRVYGERLPGQILIPKHKPYRFALQIRSGTHRVMNLELLTEEDIASSHLLKVELKSMETLRQLPFGQQSLSFFETDGPRKGYVRDSQKPYERLLMSWWALDWRVGEDKDFGPREETGTTFYTSLKLWAREESDLWNFNRFLRYWGWHF